jgi:hypothetical protein
VNIFRECIVPLCSYNLWTPPSNGEYCFVPPCLFSKYSLLLKGELGRPCWDLHIFSSIILSIPCLVFPWRYFLIAILCQGRCCFILFLIAINAFLKHALPFHISFIAYNLNDVLFSLCIALLFIILHFIID